MNQYDEPFSEYYNRYKELLDKTIPKDVLQRLLNNPEYNRGGLGCDIHDRLSAEIKAISELLGGGEG